MRYTYALPLLGLLLLLVIAACRIAYAGDALDDAIERVHEGAATERDAEVAHALGGACYRHVRGIDAPVRTFVEKICSAIGVTGRACEVACEAHLLGDSMDFDCMGPSPLPDAKSTQTTTWVFTFERGWWQELDSGDVCIYRIIRDHKVEIYKASPYRRHPWVFIGIALGGVIAVVAFLRLTPK